MGAWGGRGARVSKKSKQRGQNAEELTLWRTMSPAVSTRTSPKVRPASEAICIPASQLGVSRLVPEDIIELSHLKKLKSKYHTRIPYEYGQKRVRRSRTCGRNTLGESLRRGTRNWADNPIAVLCIIICHGDLVDAIGVELMRTPRPL